MPRLLAGIDVGTSGVRCMLFDLQGSLVGGAYREYAPTYLQPGWVEQDCDHMLAQTMRVCREAIAQGDVAPADIAAIGFSSQGNVTLAVDRCGRLLRPLISWQDARTQPDMPAILRLVSAEEYYAITGLPLIPNLMLTKIHWMRHHEPAIYARTDKFIQHQDVILKAFGADAYYTDLPSMSFYGVWDVRATRWHTPLLERFDLAPERFGEPTPPGTHVGARPVMPVNGTTTFEVLLNLASNLGVKVNAHVLENIADRAGEPMIALEMTGALGPNLLLNHMIHVTDNEMALLAAHDVRLTHNPLSNMRLASGTMRLPAFHQAGIKVGLGTDGPGANDNSNFFDVMRSAVGLQRVTSLQATVYPTVPDVLRMATLGGAELLDLEAQIGSLTPGKKADLIILNPATPNFASGLNRVNQIVFSAAPSNVEWVFVDGRPLKKKGKLVNVQPAAVIAAAEAAIARIRQDWIDVGTFPE